jgi:hypothetical protein
MRLTIGRNKSFPAQTRPSPSRLAAVAALIPVAQV